MPNTVFDHAKMADWGIPEKILQNAVQANKDSDFFGTP